VVRLENPLHDGFEPPELVTCGAALHTGRTLARDHLPSSEAIGPANPLHDNVHTIGEPDGTRPPRLPHVHLHNDAPFLAHRAVVDGVPHRCGHHGLRGSGVTSRIAQANDAFLPPTADGPSKHPMQLTVIGDGVHHFVDVDDAALEVASHGRSTKWS